MFEYWFQAKAGVQGSSRVIDYASSGARGVPHERADLVGFVRRLDWVLLLAVGAVVAYGLWAVAGITRHDVDGNENYYVVRQAVAAGLGFAGFLVALAIDPDRYRRAQKGIYAVTLLLMLLVFPLAGHDPRVEALDRARPFQFQPSEFGKLLFVLALAGFLADRARRLHEPRVVLQAVGLALLPVLLVFKQPDLGTALVYTVALGACLFVAGIRWSHLAVLISVAVLAVASVVWFLPGAGIEVLKPYQTARLTGFTNPDRDPSRRDVQRHPVDHGRRLGRARAVAASRAPRRRASTTCPSTTPTSSSRRSPSSGASSARRSCSASICSSSGAGCA